MTDNKDFWKIVQRELKKSQPSHAYSTWFKPIKSMGIHDGKLLLELPNQFFYDWIQSHYVELIDRFVKKEYPDKLVIKYTVAPQNLPIEVKDANFVNESNSSPTSNKAKKSLNENYTFLILEVPLVKLCIYQS